MSWSLCLVLAILLSSSVLLAQPASQWTVRGRGHIPLEQFIIQSHRGAGELAAENTLEAFEMGWNLGTIPECDLRTTRDGVIVTFHDDNFARVVKGLAPDMAKEGVADVTWEQLSKMDVGAWKGESFVGRRVSKVTDAFALMRDRPERRMYLDIKNVKLEQLADHVREYGVQRQVILASTHHEIIRKFKSLIPESHTLLWMGGKEDALAKRLADLRKTNYEGITQLQIHVHPRDKLYAGPDSFTPSRDFLTSTGREMRGRGILFQVLPYGAVTPDLYHTLLDLGVMSFATDRPDVTLDAVRAYYAK